MIILRESLIAFSFFVQFERLAIIDISKILCYSERINRLFLVRGDNG